MNGSDRGWIHDFRAGREVKAIIEDCPPGKEEGKGVLSSISTSFPEIQTGSENHWRYLAFRFADKEVILYSFPFLPCRAASLRHSMPLPSLSIT